MTTTLSGARTRGWFVDSSAFFASLNVRDANYPQALATLRRAAAERRPLLTTNFVVAETHALLLTRVGYRTAADFLKDWSADSIIRVGVEDEDAARAIIFRYDDNAFSLVDATSFAVMERRGLRTAFTFDSDFAQYGFELATP